MVFFCRGIGYYIVGIFIFEFIPHHFNCNEVNFILLSFIFNVFVFYKYIFKIIFNGNRMVERSNNVTDCNNTSSVMLY